LIPQQDPDAELYNEPEDHLAESSSFFDKYGEFGPDEIPGYFDSVNDDWEEDGTEYEAWEEDDLGPMGDYDPSLEGDR
jgi:hypothetical protein